MCLVTKSGLVGPGDPVKPLQPPTLQGPPPKAPGPDGAPGTAPRQASVLSSPAGTLSSGPPALPLPALSRSSAPTSSVRTNPGGPGAPPLGPPVVLTAGPVSKEAQGDRHLGGGWGLESWMSFSIRHLPPKTAVPPSLPAGLSQGWAPGEQGTRPVGHTYKWWQVRDGRTVGKCVRTQVSDSGPQQ